MDAPSPICPDPAELQKLVQALARSVPHRSAQDGAEADLRKVIDRSIEAAVKARVAGILEGIGNPFCFLDRDWRPTYINRAAEAYFGIPREELLGQMVWNLHWPFTSEWRTRCEGVLLSGQPDTFEGPEVSPPGQYLEFHVFPYEGGIAVSFRDWTERRRAAEELRESQARLSALADSLPLGMVYQVTDAGTFDTRRFTYVSASCERLNGVPAEKALENPNHLIDLILPEHRDRVFKQQLEAHRMRKAFDIEFPIRHAKTGEIRWQRIVDAPRVTPNGTTVWDGLQIDITDHKRAEDHLRLLLNELNHRVKNTLAIVQSMAAQSFQQIDRQDERFNDARQAFEARLFALARGHDVLTRENWEGASLEKIVAEACAAYRIAPERGGIFEIEGPDIRVTPSMALSLSMALHELCTNALKHGALGAPGGRIAISWSACPAGKGRRLLMRWQERGGPPASPPARKGFGSRLIEQGLARELDGTVQLAFEPEGLVCTIDVPLA